MIKIDVDDFKTLYKAYGYEDFTEMGLETLFDHLNESEIEIAFDPVAINYDWGEFTKENLIEEYSYLLEEGEENTIEKIIERLEDKTIVLTNENTFLVQGF